MMSHDNLTWTARATLEHVRDTGFGQGPREELVSYLPLSHIAAQLLDIYLPMAITAQDGVSCRVTFARPDALRGTLGTTLKQVSCRTSFFLSALSWDLALFPFHDKRRCTFSFQVRPTSFLGVPRVWEKIQEKLKDVAAAMRGTAMASISTWSKKQGTAQIEWEQVQAGTVEPAPRGFFQPLKFFLAKIILSKIHAKLGLDRCKLFGTAAAPMALTTWRYFGSLYVPIMDLYGMSGECPVTLSRLFTERSSHSRIYPTTPDVTECTGPQTCSLPSLFHAGHVGKALPAVAMDIRHVAGRDKEGEGEICYRGRHIMMGYLDDEEKTRETIDRKGWLRSGDVGSVDESLGGLLRITGRVKEVQFPAVAASDASSFLLPTVQPACLLRP